jgi:hypothetical protein
LDTFFLSSLSLVRLQLKKSVDGIRFYDNQANSEHCGKQPELRQKDECKSDDDCIYRFSKEAKIQFIHNLINPVEMVDRDKAELWKLIAQIKIYEGKVDHKKGYGNDQFWIKNEKDGIKHQELYSIGDDIDLRPQNGFLFEETCPITIRHITYIMDDQTDIVIRGIHFYDRQHKKDERTHESDHGDDVGDTETAFRWKRRKHLIIFLISHFVFTPFKKF